MLTLVRPGFPKDVQVFPFIALTAKIDYSAGSFRMAFPSSVFPCASRAPERKSTPIKSVDSVSTLCHGLDLAASHQHQYHRRSTLHVMVPPIPTFHSWKVCSSPYLLLVLRHPEVFLTILNPSVPLPAPCPSRAPQVGSLSSAGSSSSLLSQAQETPRAPKGPVSVLVVAEESHPCWLSPVHTDLFPWEPC